MARHLIMKSSTGETHLVGDSALAFFPGYAIIDTLEDGQPPAVFYGSGESDLRYVNVTELSDAASPGRQALSQALANETAAGTSVFAVAQRAASVPKWKPSTAVVAGEVWMAPDGKTISRNSDGTTRASYDSTEQALWTVTSGGNVADASTTTKGIVELATSAETTTGTDTARATTPAGVAAAIAAAGSGVTAGTVAGQIPVWDGDSYEPQTPTAVSPSDLGLTPLLGSGARLTPPPQRIITRFASGHGWTGGADDTTVKLYGDRSYKGTTDGVGTQKVLAGPSTPVTDWSGTVVRVTFRVDDPSKLGSTQFVVDAPSGSTYTFSIVGSTNAGDFLTANEWQTFTFPLAAASTSGTPTWTTVSRPRLVTRDRGAGAVNVWMAAVELLPNLSAVYPNGVVVLEADDGFASHKTILRPMLDSIGVPCTFNPIIERITNGQAGMTIADLRDMQDRSGWQISAHAYSQTFHNGSVGTPADAAADFLAIKKWLHDNGFHAGADDFALCPGVGNRLSAGALRDTVASFWRSARMFTGFNETVVPADPLSFRSIGFSGNSVSQLQANIDQSAGPGGVFHLSIHDVLTGATNGTSAGLAAIAVDNLKTVLQYAAGKSMVFRTRGDWLALR
jgi:hypothetical protein